MISGTTAARPQRFDVAESRISIQGMQRLEQRADRLFFVPASIGGIAITGNRLLRNDAAQMIPRTVALPIAHRLQARPVLIEPECVGAALF